MGKATESKSSQVHYVKNRIQLLKNVIDSVDADAADVEDLERIMKMLTDLQIKLNRFHKDWTGGNQEEA